MSNWFHAQNSSSALYSNKSITKLIPIQARYGTNLNGYLSGMADLVPTLLQSPTKVLAHLPTFATSLREIYQFVPFLQFSVVYRDEFVIAHLQHCQEEGGSLF